MPQDNSIEQLENDFWSDPDPFPSALIECCHQYRKIPINHLTPAQIAVLLRQNIGTQHIIHKTLEILKNDPLVKAEFYRGDLLFSLSAVHSSFWTTHSTIQRAFHSLITDNRQLISEELGEKDYSALNSMTSSNSSSDW